MSRCQPAVPAAAPGAGHPRGGSQTGDLMPADVCHHRPFSAPNTEKTDVFRVYTLEEPADYRHEHRIPPWMVTLDGAGPRSSELLH